MEMPSSLRGDKHEFSFVVIEFKHVLVQKTHFIYK